MNQQAGLITPRRKGTEVSIRPQQTRVWAAQQNLKAHEELTFSAISHGASPTVIQKGLAMSQVWEDKLFYAMKELMRCVFS